MLLSLIVEVRYSIAVVLLFLLCGVVISVATNHNMHFGTSTFLAPYLHKFSAVVHIKHFFLVLFCKNCIKFGANLGSKLKKKYAETAPSNGAI